MTSTKLLFSSDPELLRKELENYDHTITVEAEYGEICVEGSVLTLAHHGSRSSNPAPCVCENQKDLVVDAIGFSHIDLDSFGGMLAIFGIKPENSDFWKLAEFVDVNGPHKISESGASDEMILALNAYWAFNQNHRDVIGRIPRDSVMTLSLEDFQIFIDALNGILEGNEDLLSAGREFQQADEALNQSSFIEMTDSGVVVRVSDSFVNHLYDCTSGIGKAVVGYSTKTHGITLSFADPISGVSVVEILQDIFGPEAGGRDTIGGSPRGVHMTVNNLAETVLAVDKALKNA